MEEEWGFLGGGGRRESWAPPDIGSAQPASRPLYCVSFPTPGPPAGPPSHCPPSAASSPSVPACGRRFEKFRRTHRTHRTSALLSSPPSGRPTGKSEGGGTGDPGHDKRQGEFELLDAGVFNEDRYFDVFVEYAKADTDDILIKITATNRGPETANLRLLPTVWFRNTWSWGSSYRSGPPQLSCWSVRLGTAIPNAPANVGSFQFFTVLALRLFGEDKTVAVGFSMVYFLALTVPLWILGLLAISRTGMNLSTIRFEAAALRRYNGRA